MVNFLEASFPEKYSLGLTLCPQLWTFNPTSAIYQDC